MLIAALLAATAFARPAPMLEAGVATSYVRGGAFDGPGFAAQALWAPTEWFALGPAVDIAYLSSGPLNAGNGLPASYSFTSTLAGAVFEFRLPIPVVQPYASLSVGYVAVGNEHGVNTQCGFNSGFGGALSAGARAGVGDHLTVGLRGSARPPSVEGYCLAIAGPAGFDDSLLLALGGTLDYRW
jgi:hypothetical protein